MVTAARGTVGVRFRTQGRDPAYGLDCVGVAAVALRAGGYSGPVPEGYALRTGAFSGEMCGLVACDGDRAGDLVLCRAGPGQLHLVVLTNAGFVHADAGLRRVVERPGVVPWPVVTAWRIDEGDDSWRR